MAQIQVEQSQISVIGKLDQLAVCTLSKQPIKLVDGVVYELNLSGLDHIDSAGLAYLVNIISKQQLSGGNIQVSTLTEQLKQLIELSDVGMLFQN